MRRFALLLAAGTLWLFLAALPAFADGGPHVASINSGSTSLTADGCAGCHRAHTAQGEGLLVEASAEALCLSCHDATGTGSAVDVVTGVQYIKASVDGPIPGAGKSDDPILGYLRDGGFEKAHLGSSDGELTRIGYYRNATAVSFRMKVPVEAAAEPTTSAHLALAGTGVVAKNKMWGKGLSNAVAPVVSMECTSCHNPHGNGQYRILNKLNTTDQITTSTAVGITAVKAETNRFFTAEAHSLIVGDIVTINGVSGVTNGQYIVKSIAGNAFTVAATSATPTTADIANAVLDVTADVGAGGTVQRWASIVDDAPLPGAGDTRNYTILQVRGTQGTNGSYLLYESNVLAARGGGSYQQGAGIDYSATSGDYFHRTVPWNPALTDTTVAAACNTATVATGTCLTANDAPNGRAATTGTQIAYNDQISAWCSTCHTRYYSSTNQNPGGEPSSTADTSKAIASATGNGMTSPVGSTNSFGYSVGDIVRFSNTGTTDYYVTAYSTSGTGGAQTSTFSVALSLDGVTVAAPAGVGNTVIRMSPFSASSWYFPRNGTDTQYKFQHQTTTNRACTTCHVGHGTDATMQTTGLTTFSNDLAYPDGTAGTSGYNSRLLKIDNRGTCQACHDPTGTATAGTQLGNQTAPTVP
ncbi:MAG TPA: cytochrome c3 family protein [Candidatus Limnocylindrales bacterium]